MIYIIYIHVAIMQLMASTDIDSHGEVWFIPVCMVLWPLQFAKSRLVLAYQHCLYVKLTHVFAQLGQWVSMRSASSRAPVSITLNPVTI